MNLCLVFLPPRVRCGAQELCIPSIFISERKNMVVSGCFRVPPLFMLCLSVTIGTITLRLLSLVENKSLNSVGQSKGHLKMATSKMNVVVTGVW